MIASKIMLSCSTYDLLYRPNANFGKVNQYKHYRDRNAQWTSANAVMLLVSVHPPSKSFKLHQIPLYHLFPSVHPYAVSPTGSFASSCVP